MHGATVDLNGMLWPVMPEHRAALLGIGNRKGSHGSIDQGSWSSGTLSRKHIRKRHRRISLSGPVCGIHEYGAKSVETSSRRKLLYIHHVGDERRERVECVCHGHACRLTPERIV